MRLRPSLGKRDDVLDRGVLAPPSLVWGVSLDEREREWEGEEISEALKEHLDTFITSLLFKHNTDAASRDLNASFPLLLEEFFRKTRHIL